MSKMWRKIYIIFFHKQARYTRCSTLDGPVVMWEGPKKISFLVREPTRRGQAGRAGPAGLPVGIGIPIGIGILIAIGIPNPIGIPIPIPIGIPGAMMIDDGRRSRRYSV